jgi:hypothetical protein
LISSTRGLLFQVTFSTAPKIEASEVIQCGFSLDSSALISRQPRQWRRADHKPAPMPAEAKKLTQSRQRRFRALELIASVERQLAIRYHELPLTSHAIRQIA